MKVFLASYVILCVVILIVRPFM